MKVCNRSIPSMGGSCRGCNNNTYGPIEREFIFPDIQLEQKLKDLNQFEKLSKDTEIMANDIRS